MWIATELNIHSRYNSPYELFFYIYFPQEPCQLTDQLLEQYSTEIKMLNNRGRPIFVNDPPSPEMVPSHDLAHIDHDWRGIYQDFFVGGRGEGAFTPP